MSKCPCLTSIVIGILIACVATLLLAQQSKYFCSAKAARFTAIEVTIVDEKACPIAGATINPYDTSRNLLDDSSLLVIYSDRKGKIVENVFKRDKYYIQASALGFVTTKKWIVSVSNTVRVRLVLVRNPLPSYSTTLISAKIIDTEGKAIEGGGILVSDESGNDLGNLQAGLSFSDAHGRIKQRFKTGGTYVIQAFCSDYLSSEVKIVSRPGVIPVTFVLTHENRTIELQKQQAYLKEMQKKSEDGTLPFAVKIRKK